jgi:serine/threonine-protein kinase
MPQYDRKKREFEMMQKTAALGVPMCLPVEFGTCPDGVYTLHSWIDGADLTDALPSLPEAEQYALGVRSGEILRVIHSIPAPDTLEEWESRFNKKIDRKITAYMEYKEQSLTGEEEERFIEYVNANRFLLKNRPQCFHHGDYHTGNMMLQNGELVIIDFGRFDFGDPWEEYNRIVWSAQASPRFASGQLHGYFGGEPPAEFFGLLALYMVSNQLGHIGWAAGFGDEEYQIAVNMNQEVLRWYDGMRTVVPLWYSSFDAADSI